MLSTGVTKEQLAEAVGLVGSEASMQRLEGWKKLNQWAQDDAEFFEKGKKGAYFMILMTLLQSLEQEAVGLGKKKKFRPEGTFDTMSERRTEDG